MISVTLTYGFSIKALRHLSVKDCYLIQDLVNNGFAVRKDPKQPGGGVIRYQSDATEEVVDKLIEEYDLYDSVVDRIKL